MSIYIWIFTDLLDSQLYYVDQQLVFATTCARYLFDQLPRAINHLSNKSFFNSSPQQKSSKGCNQSISWARRTFYISFVSSQIQCWFGDEIFSSSKKMKLDFFMNRKRNEKEKAKTQMTFLIGIDSDTTTLAIKSNDWRCSL